MVEEHFTQYQISFTIGNEGELPEAQSLTVGSFSELISFLLSAVEALNKPDLPIWFFAADYIDVEAIMREKPRAYYDEENMVIAYKDSLIEKALNQENCHGVSEHRAVSLFNLFNWVNSGKKFAGIQFEKGSLYVGFSPKEHRDHQAIENFIRQALQDGLDELTKPCAPKSS